MKNLLLIFTLFVLLAGGCTARQNINTEDLQTTVLHNIDAVKAGELIASKISNEDFIILDVRTQEEYESGCLKNAINIDYNGSDFKEKLSKLDKDKTYLIHCRSGRRSAETAGIMEDMGFTDIYDLNGGINGWMASSGVVVESCICDADEVC